MNDGTGFGIIVNRVLVGENGTRQFRCTFIRRTGLMEMLAGAIALPSVLDKTTSYHR